MIRVFTLASLAAAVCLSAAAGQERTAAPLPKVAAPVPPRPIARPGVRVAGLAAPRPMVVAKVDADKGVIAFEHVVMVPVTKTVLVEETREIDGRVEKVTKEVPVTELVPEKRLVQWSAKDNVALDGVGDKLDGKKLWDRVKAGDTVLMLSGRTLDAAWKKVLKPEVVILTQEAAPVPNLIGN